MTTSNVGADSLVFKVSGTEITHLVAIGTVDGVVVDAVGARNAPGTGYLRIHADGHLQWKAPSGSFGPRVNVAGGGTFTLEDGGDRGKWIRVTVTASYLPTVTETGRVLLADAWDNGLAADDVTAAEASAGDTATYQVTVENASGRAVTDVVVWLDASTADMEISDDGAAWVNPTSEGSGLALADLEPGGTDTLHLRRTIGASEPSDPEVLNDLRYSFKGL